VPTGVAWKAALSNANAQTETKLKPKTKPGTTTETYNDIGTNCHINAERRDDIAADTDQMMGDSLTMKLKHAG